MRQTWMLVLIVFSLCSCGVEGSLYLPDKQPPAKPKRSIPTPTIDDNDEFDSRN